MINFDPDEPPGGYADDVPPGGYADEQKPKKGKKDYGAFLKAIGENAAPGAEDSRRAKNVLSGATRGLNAMSGLGFRAVGDTKNAEYMDEKIRKMKAAEVASGDNAWPMSLGDVGQAIPAAATGLLAMPALGAAGIGAGTGFLGRAGVNAYQAATGTFATNPGDISTRTKDAGIAALAAPALQGVLEGGVNGLRNVSPAIQSMAQKAAGVTDKAKSTAIRRLQNLAKLNAKHGTNLELSLGQLTDAPQIKGAESAAEYFPLGMSGPRQKGNEETIKILKSRAARSAAERDATKFRNVEDIFDDIANPEVVVGDKNAARILQESVEPSGTNNERILAASADVNMYPLKKRNNELYRMAGEEGDVLGPISMEGEPERLAGLAAGLERRLGKESTSVGTARSLAEDMSRAQGELFPSPNAVWETGAGRTMQNKPADFYTGHRNRAIPGSVEEELERAGRISTGPIQALPSNGRHNFAGNTNPASESKDLNVANILKSISALKEEAAGLRRAGKDGLAGEIDQIVTGMDTRLQQAASRNPDVRATLDAAALDYKQSVLPAQNAGTATTLHGPNKEAIKVPEAIALEDKGQAAVRNLADENALAKGQDFGGRELDIVDNDKAATILGDRALDQFYQGANEEERRMLLEILRSTTENPQITKNPKTGARNMFMEPIKAALGGAAGLGTGLALGPASKGVFNTEFGRKFFLNNPNFRKSINSGNVPAWLANLLAQENQ